MKNSYLDLLKDPRWQKKRLKIMERDDFTCQMCGDRKATLAIHHKKYIWGRKPWDYLDKDLITFCEDCHSIVTASMLNDWDKIIQKQNLGGYWIYIATKAWEIIIIEKTSLGTYKHIAVITGGVLTKIIESIKGQQKSLKNEKRKSSEI